MGYTDRDLSEDERNVSPLRMSASLAAVRILRRREWQRFRIHANGGREFERIFAAARIRQLDERGGPTERRLLDVRDIRPVRLRLQQSRSVTRTDRFESKIAALGVCRLPQRH